MDTFESHPSEVAPSPQVATESGEGTEGGDPTPSGSYATVQPEPEPPELARSPDILEEFDRALKETGLAGDTTAAKIIFLAILSRFQDRPVSVVLKGLSSAGKSFTVSSVLRFFQQGAYHVLTAMSEHLLAYSETPLVHRMLVLYEAEALRGDMASYLMRSLLSEGEIRYATVEKTSDGSFKERIIKKDGPTGLISTTTRISLHPENETRLFSITLSDSDEQTVNVFLALADEDRVEPDLTRWLDLDRWLAGEDRKVSIPYAGDLAKRMNPAAVRLRRDFDKVLRLIRAHAFLHQANRIRDSRDRILANLDDYRAVWSLVKDIVSEGAGSSVSESVRETVGAVEEILGDGNRAEVTVVQVANALGLDKSTASRRVKRAVEGGYVVNLEQGKGNPLRLVVGDPLPEEKEILPRPEALQSGCTVATDLEGTDSLSGPSSGTNQVCSHFEGDDTEKPCEFCSRPLLEHRH